MCSETALDEAELPAGGADRARRGSGGEGRGSSPIRRRRSSYGVFGAPSFIVDGELYFGKDRLREVEEAILDG